MWVNLDLQGLCAAKPGVKGRSPLLLLQNQLTEHIITNILRTKRLNIQTGRTEIPMQDSSSSCSLHGSYPVTSSTSPQYLKKNCLSPCSSCWHRLICSSPQQSPYKRYSPLQGNQLIARFLPNQHSTSTDGTAEKHPLPKRDYNPRS